MELQQHLGEFQGAAIKLFAISYDSVDVLSAFAKLHGIQFPLLSDRDSAVIKRFGILNTLIKPEETEYYGVPYPGSYLVGVDGRVIAKFFNREYQVRENSVTVLRSGFDVPVDPRAFAHAEGSNEGIDITVTFSATELRFMQHADLYITFDLPSGLHIYGPSVPEGYVPTEITVTGTEGLRVGKAEFPATKPFRIEGLAEEFQVLEHRVVVRVPIVCAIRGVPSVSMHVGVRYQACDDHQCFLPSTREFCLEVPLGQIVRE